MLECTQVNFLRNHGSDGGKFVFAFMHGGTPPSPFPLCPVRLVAMTVSFYPVVLYLVLSNIAKQGARGTDRFQKVVAWLHTIHQHIFPYLKKIRAGAGQILAHFTVADDAASANTGIVRADDPRRRLDLW